MEIIKTAMGGGTKAHTSVMVRRPQTFALTVCVCVYIGRKKSSGKDFKIDFAPLVHL